MEYRKDRTTSFSLLKLRNTIRIHQVSVSNFWVILLLLQFWPETNTISYDNESAGKVLRLEVWVRLDAHWSDANNRHQRFYLFTFSFTDQNC